MEGMMMAAEPVVTVGMIRKAGRFQVCFDEQSGGQR